MKRLLALCLLLALLLCACSAAGQPTQPMEQPTEETGGRPDGDGRRAEDVRPVLPAGARLQPLYLHGNGEPRGVFAAV